MNIAKRSAGVLVIALLVGCASVDNQPSTDAAGWSPAKAMTKDFQTAMTTDAAVQALKDGNEDPKARDLLVKHMNTAPEIAQTVPLSYYNMVKDLKPQEIADFQNLVDQATAYGLVKSKVDVKTMLKTY